MKKLLLALFTLSISTAFAQDEMLDNTFGGFGAGQLLDGAIPGLSANCIAFQESTNRIFVGGGGWASTAQVQSFIVANYVFLGAGDPGFGTGGFAHADFGFVGAEVTCMRLQTDGKIVVAGPVGVGANKHFGVARFLANGQLDSAFATNGTIIINFGFGNETPLEIMVLLDGKILVAGNLNDASFGVARLTANGTLDNLFGGDGTIDSDLPNNQPLKDIAFTAEGKIYATSSVLNQDAYDFVVLKYASNGSPDLGFGTNGMLSVDINQTDDFAKAIAIQPDGKIIIAGETSINIKSVFVARYTQFGTVDPLFGNTGITTTVTNSTVEDVTIQPDGKVVIGGTLTLTEGHPYDYMVARYTGDGTADNTFGGDGLINTDFASFDNTFNAICLQPDGRILAVGETEYDFWPGATAITLCRYLPSLTIGIVEFELGDNAPLLYPNPLNDVEHLKYTLVGDEQISIVLLDSQGKLVATFVENEKQVMGDHEVELNLPNGLPNGNYFIQIASPKGKISIKAVK